MRISKDRILDVLKSKGIDMRELMKNPAIQKKACKVVYKAIPIPWRWFIGKKRIRRFVNMAVTIIER